LWGGGTHQHRGEKPSISEGNLISKGKGRIDPNPFSWGGGGKKKERGQMGVLNGEEKSRKG